MLTILFLAAMNSQAEPVARFETFMKGARTFSADLEFTASGRPAIGKGTFHVKRPGYLLFRMVWDKSDFSFSIGPKSAIAIERADKVYREYGALGRMFIPDTDISDTPMYSLPVALMLGSLDAIVPDGVKFESGGTADIEGVKVDVVRASFDTQAGHVVQKVMIDGSGRPLQFIREVSGGGRSFVATIKTANYKINIPLEDEFFEVPPPLGFVPQTLPADAYPLNVGERITLAGWKKLAAKEELSALASGKSLFLAVTEPSCEVSKSAATVVAKLVKEIEAKGGVSAAINIDSNSTQPVAFSGLPTYVDPNGKLVESLRVPGTPLFLLVDPKGVVSRVWLGFDPAEADAFRADVLEWVGKPARPPL